ncbi:MAG: hypothetical protein ACLTYN_15670 [Dysosmobacter welbionis]
MCWPAASCGPWCSPEASCCCGGTGWPVAGRVPGPEGVGLLAAAGCVVCVNWGVYIWAVANGHMIDSSLAYYMNPILAILLGTVLFRERLTTQGWRWR